MQGKPLQCKKESLFIWLDLHRRPLVEIPLKNGLKGVKSVSDSKHPLLWKEGLAKVLYSISVCLYRRKKNVWLDLHRRPLVEIPLKRGVKEVNVVSDVLTSPSLHRKGRLKKIHQKTAKSKGPPGLTSIGDPWLKSPLKRGVKSSPSV